MKKIFKWDFNKCHNLIYNFLFYDIILLSHLCEKRGKDMKKSKLFKETGIVGFIIAIIYIAITWWAPEVFEDPVETNALVEFEDNLQIHFVDVGQADAILITQGDNAMLVDAGENETRDELKDYITSQGISNLDYVVATHPHSDHIGAMYYIIDNFNVNQVLMSGKTHTTKTYEKLLTSIKNKNIEKMVPKLGDKFTLGDATFEIVGPTYKSSYGDNLNDYSLVIKLTFGNNTFLFTGDAEENSEEDMVASGINLKCDLLKVGHHGSSTATTEEFLNAVEPKYAVVSVGKDNSYGLPDGRVMKLLKSYNIPVYRTDESGTIVATSDGNKITFNKQPGTYSYID